MIRSDTCARGGSWQILTWAAGGGDAAEVHSSHSCAASRLPRCSQIGCTGPRATQHSCGIPSIQLDCRSGK